MSIGVVMPTFNQKDFIEEAIASIVYQVDHLIVVNDGSTDGTRELLDKMNSQYPIRVVHFVENRMPATAINTGVALLRKMDFDLEWISWASSDNVHMPHWIERLLEHTDRSVGAVYSGFIRKMCPGPKHKTRVRYNAHRKYRLEETANCYYGPSFLIRNECWVEHRGKYGHDYDFWGRVEEACWERRLKIVGVPEPLVIYRVHPAQAAQRHPERCDQAHWRQKLLERRGAAK